MLTVNPRNRANISTICAHWWVNETYEESCLDISEELANLTPVRLDLLLSLAPPPPQLESEKLVVTGDVRRNRFTFDTYIIIFNSFVGTRRNDERIYSRTDEITICWQLDGITNASRT